MINEDEQISERLFINCHRTNGVIFQKVSYFPLTQVVTSFLFRVLFKRHSLYIDITMFLNIMDKFDLTCFDSHGAI